MNERTEAVWWWHRMFQHWQRDHKMEMDIFIELVLLRNRCLKK